MCPPTGNGSTTRISLPPTGTFTVCCNFCSGKKKQRGEHRGRWVLKTPAHLGYLDTLFRTFPDAHVIHMHRHPLETIPSGASLNTTLWRMHADDVDPTRVGKQWIERMAFTNGRALEERSRLDDTNPRFTDVWFRDAVSNPIEQVERIYSSNGIVLTDAVRSEMENWLKSDAQSARVPHRYTAADFGLSENQILQVFFELHSALCCPVRKPGCDRTGFQVISFGCAHSLHFLTRG